MSSLELNKNVCRICLEHKVDINWNDEIPELSGVSYKDCYYKYTNLTEMNPDSYPSNLCKKCAEEIKNAHVLFEKALKSFNILQKLASKCFNMDTSFSAIKDECRDFVVPNVDDERFIEIEDKPCFTLCETKQCLISANSSNETNIVTNNDNTVVEPTHFIDIHNFESSVEKPLEDHFDERCSEVSNLITPKKIRGKRKNVGTKLPKSFDEQGIDNSDSLSSTTKKTRKRKNWALLLEGMLSKNTSKSCENNDNSLEICKKESTESAKSSKEKYLLMCSYCSLKVYGAKKLEKHEATHNENRERTVTCPECGLKLYTDLSLNIHMKIHDTNRQKNHKCEFCEKAFFNKGALNVHRRIHLGQMIKCQICEKEFFRQVDLDKHLLKHAASPLEKNVGKKKYVAQCQYCNKSILTDKLKEHIAVHLDQPQVKCKICDKNFYSRTKCTNHLRRFHLKKLSEYEDFIHYYVDRNKRLSSLMIKQQLVVQPLK